MGRYSVLFWISKICWERFTRSSLPNTTGSGERPRSECRWKAILRDVLTAWTNTSGVERERKMDHGATCPLPVARLECKDRTEAVVTTGRLFIRSVGRADIVTGSLWLHRVLIRFTFVSRGLSPIWPLEYKCVNKRATCGHMAPVRYLSCAIECTRFSLEIDEITAALSVFWEPLCLSIENCIHYY